MTVVVFVLLPMTMCMHNIFLILMLNFFYSQDKQAYPIIRVVDKLPAVKIIDFSDNRLTDLTLMPLAHKLQKMPSLTYLDLSFNKMDDSSETIREYLMNESCHLGTLLLNGADVDDFECVDLASAIEKNKSLHTLGLANNLIGQAEMMNTANPSLGLFLETDA